MIVFFGRVVDTRMMKGTHSNDLHLYLMKKTSWIIHYTMKLERKKHFA